MFQYLIANRNRPIPRGTLMEALWPDPDAAAPETSLKVTVHALRQTLRRWPDGIGLELRTSEAGYGLWASDLWLDAEEFQHSCSRARMLERQDEQAAALAAYEQAIDLYNGEFIAESNDGWVLLRRESLKDQYLLSLGRLADSCFDHRDYHGCLLYCQRLLEHDPCREDAYRRVMLCHARLGQLSRVRSWYELCVRTLRTELDLDPEPETRWLLDRAMRGELGLQGSIS